MNAGDVSALLCDPSNLKNPAQISQIARARGLELYEEAAERFAVNILADEAAWQLLKQRQYSELQKRLRSSHLATSRKPSSTAVKASVPPQHSTGPAYSSALPAPLQAVGTGQTVTVEMIEKDDVDDVGQDDDDAPPPAAAAAAAAAAAPAPAGANDDEIVEVGVPVVDAATRRKRKKAEWAKEERKKKKKERDARIASMDEGEKAAFENEESERRAAMSLKRKEQRRAKTGGGSKRAKQ